tara:strand:- start:50 stop:490 length:441 start_codon:yes stop_codon:yes gene_type:complete
MTFSSDLKKFTKKADKNLSKTIRASAAQVFGAVIKSTPVGNPTIWKNSNVKDYVGGRLRNNWNTSLNSIDESANRPPDNSGSGSEGDLLIAMGRYKNGDTIYLSNSLPYAQAVEEGWSKQRPHGMVKVNVKKWKRAMAANARKFNK